MRDHETCEEAINAALAKGHDGFAEFLATRCDRRHGELEPTRDRPEPRPKPAPTAEVAAVRSQITSDEESSE